MKKKILVTLLSFVLTASMVGCGNRTDPSMAQDVNPSTVEATEQTEENDPAVESESTAESGENKESEEESTAVPTPEPTQAPDSTPDAQESTEGAEPTTPVAESSDVTAPTEQAAAYTVTEMAATMYVKDSVNLRQGPGTEYAKVGNLAKGQQVTVTGQAGNGWYQLDSGAFVSNKYLTDTEPTQQVAGVTPVDTTQPVDAAGVGTVIPTITTTNASSGVDFVNYLNQQRSTAGLGTLTWDDGMAAVAQRRAQEITTDLSHNGNVEKYGEIIQLAVTGSASDWYTSWYNSEAHRTSMLAVNYTRAGCAVYAIGNNYYVVCNFAGTPASTEQLIEQARPENLIPAGGNEDGSTAGFSTTGETLNPGDPNYDFINDIFEKYIEEDNK